MLTVPLVLLIVWSHVVPHAVLVAFTVILPALLILNTSAAVTEPV